LLVTAVEGGEGWTGGDRLHRTEARAGWAVSKTRLVVPSTSLLRQNSREPFAVEIDPLVAGTESNRQILKRVRVDIAHPIVDCRFAVRELNRGERAALPRAVNTIVGPDPLRSQRFVK
jgi:hypothetical protein